MATDKNLLNEAFKEFLGRETELKTLMEAHAEVQEGKEGPRIVNIISDSGYGKTRLLYEFYKKVREKHNEKSFWPTELCEDITRIKLNPAINAEFKFDDIPYFWWGMRWLKQSDDRNSYVNNFSANIDFSVINSLIKKAAESKEKKEFAINVFKSAAEMVPGIGIAFQLGGILTYVTKKLPRMMDIWRNRNLCTPQKNEHADKDKQIKDAIKAIIGLATRKNPVPVIIALDDIQWADKYALWFFYNIIKEFATNKDENRGQLLIVATHWEKEQKEESSKTINAEIKSEADCKSYMGILNDLMKNEILTKQNIKEIKLDKLSDGDCESILLKAFPNLGENYKRHIIEQAGGIPLVIEEFITLLENTRYKYFKDRNIANVTQEDKFKDFKTTTVNAHTRAQKRIKDLGDDIIEVLELGAIQGMSFYENLLEDVAVKIKELEQEKIKECLEKADNPYTVIKRDAELKIDEFKTPIIYREILEVLTDENKNTYHTAMAEVLMSWFLSCEMHKSPNPEGIFRFAIDFFEEFKNSDGADKAEIERTLALLNCDLAQLMVSQGRYIEAGNFYEKIEKDDIFAQFNDSDYLPAFLVHLSDYSVYLAQLGKYENAEYYLRKCIEFFEYNRNIPIPDLDLPDLDSFLENMQSNYCAIISRLGDLEYAKNGLEELLKTAKDPNSNRLSIKINLANIYDKLGKHDEANNLRDDVKKAGGLKALNAILNDGMGKAQSGELNETIYADIIKQVEEIEHTLPESAENRLYVPIWRARLLLELNKPLEAMTYIIKFFKGAKDRLSQEHTFFKTASECLWMAIKKIDEIRKNEPDS
jgi:tetratricopeptide (TPR) repeat protein